MVFKRVLKGIGRLMLTTAVMCGVGLFLCSSEVKAAVSVGLDSDNSGGFKVTINSDSNDNISSLKSVKLYSDSTVIYSIDNLDQRIEAGRAYEYTVSKKDFITGSGINSLAGDGSTVGINNVGITYVDENSAESGEIKLNPQLPSAIESAPIYKATMVYDPIDASASFSTPSFSYKNTNVGAYTQYGYAEDTIEVTANPTSPYILENYYSYYYINNSRPENAINWKWSEATDAMSITLSSNTDENNYKVTYLPKIYELKITKPDTGIVDVKVSKATSTVPASAPKVQYEINSWMQSDEQCSKTVKAYIFNCDNTEIDNNTLASLKTSDHTVGSFTVTPTLMTAGKKGSGKVTLKATLPGFDGNTIIAADKIVPVYLSVPADGFTLNSTTVSLMAGVEQQIDIIKGILPAGANQTLSNYTGDVTVTSGADLLEIPTYDNTSGKITLKAKSGVTSGTATVQIELKEGSKSLGTKPLEVKIISFSKDNTIKSINKNNKNYITYNKDKGYSLDIKQLIIDNAKDTSDNAVTITKDQIIEVYVGSSSCSDGIWKPSEAALNKKVTCKINGTAISSDSFTVSAYPMPTATYSSSNRTLSVKIPTKVATAYSDDNNIRQSKGFKLILEDSSGNTLYEYTDSKYQSVLSSSSESTVTYTVTAADIEGMITSAASNGKFSADTTSVKFKVIPMGYKQSSTSDETIKAKDEIAGKTDAVTVYKVSASGTNFTSSAAYGLDGQTVSITATPNSGYSFKQWSDGNTSNPRQVKVSASGTRSFQAVAGDRVANSTGAGGTDNSELYDDVPKTAESNSAIWLIVFMVFAVMGTTYALYLQLRAANSKHDR
ncbi:MAG: hypothetical protein SPE25_06445 [Lachnospiraceae bacterium]|nr:hypothetical protein [Lachnospiraceae bacterium]